MSIKGMQINQYSSSSIVNVKWNKTTLNDIDLDTTQDVLTFKTQIYALTNVPVDRQKIMFKGKILKVTLPPLFISALMLSLGRFRLTLDGHHCWDHPYDDGHSRRRRAEAT